MAPKKLFTERHGSGKPRVAETLDDTTREALLSLISGRIDEEWFGLSFPNKCSDGYAYAGTDIAKLKARTIGFALAWVGPHNSYIDGDGIRTKPSNDGEVFDLIEFSYEFIAEPGEPWFHSYMSHSHYSYDQEGGRAKFTEDVNRIFERNGIAFELREGEVVRVLPAPVAEALASANFNTRDAMLDELLETARHKFRHRDVAVRLEALEALWDAWERLKTVEAGQDKKTSQKALLDKAANEPGFRQRIEEDALALTKIGNDFTIRHKEANKIPVTDPAQADYLFQRMFALILLLLKATNRV